MRAGDTVEHGPSGETWVVACTESAAGRLIAAGWPETVAEINDCKIVATCTDEKHREMLEACAKHSGLRGSWARQQLSNLNQRESLEVGNNRAERKKIQTDERSATVFRLPRPQPDCTVGISEDGIELELKALIDEDEEGEIAALQLTYRPTSGDNMTHIADPDVKQIALQLPDEVVIVKIG